MSSSGSIALYCQGFNLMGKYTNGSLLRTTLLWLSILRIAVTNHQCLRLPPPTTSTPPPTFTTQPPSTPAPTSTQAPPRPRDTERFSNALSVGQTATMTASASNLVSGRRYVVVFYRKHFNQSSPQQYASTVNFTASGSTYSGSLQRR